MFNEIFNVMKCFPNSYFGYQKHKEHVGYCPDCGHQVEEPYGCPNCLRKIDWSDEELKPCPFCGGKAKIKAVIKSYGFTIWCECECRARTEGFCPETSKEDDTMENIDECKKRAIKAWNRRANDGKID